MNLLEAGMLICFGLAWPVSIARSYKSRSTGGKSALFSVVILVGYLCGICNKLFFANDWVLYLYILNFAMVSVDLALWFRNRRIETQSPEKNS